MVFIPANTSNAKIIQHLQSNNGLGIIWETEADTMGQTFKNDWGSYSDLLRKAFHHEKISISRKTNNEYFEIDNPQLAVALSGTPSQISNIIKSAEDGLFSRFVFYVFKTEVKWVDVSPSGNQINLDDHFDMLSNSVYDMVLFLEENPTIVQLSTKQWSEFNSFFENILNKICTFVSEDASSVVKRLGLIAFRFCMLFTVLRKFQSKENAIDVVCLDIDFKTALSLIDVYIEHSIMMFNNLPKNESQTSFKTLQNKELFLAALPNKFTRKEAIALAPSFSMSDRTVDGFLKTCVENGFLMQPSYRIYERVL